MLKGRGRLQASSNHTLNHIYPPFTPIYNVKKRKRLPMYPSSVFPDQVENNTRPKNRLQLNLDALVPISSFWQVPRYQDVIERKYQYKCRSGHYSHACSLLLWQLPWTFRKHTNLEAFLYSKLDGSLIKTVGDMSHIRKREHGFFEVDTSGEGWLSLICGASDMGGEWRQIFVSVASSPDLEGSGRVWNVLTSDYSIGGSCIHINFLVDRVSARS